MKKQELNRLYKFSDAKMIVVCNEKIAFIRRDQIEFNKFGITTADVDQLEALINAFENLETDGEALADQSSAAIEKDKKADCLKEAIRALMVRVNLQFRDKSAKYRMFGTDALAHQTDAELHITAKRVVRVANIFLSDLTSKGLTPAMLTEIIALNNDFATLIIDLKVTTGLRDIKREDRVKAGNAIYAVLSSYAKTGQSIWSTKDTAKCNDYVIYDTVSGEIEAA
jgi:hypothetical protein